MGIAVNLKKYRCFSESESESDNLIFGLIPIRTVMLE
jgi:hypothetical protein